MASRFQTAGSLEAVNDYLYQQNMTDGLPVVPPTEKRVEAMVSGSGRRRDDLLGLMPPLNAPATIEKVAINAVMAGCEPGYMPTVVAAVEAFLQPQAGAHSVQTTTNPAGPMIIINGPVRHELGINCGSGCFGPGTKANATIGRALRLVLVNLGGALPGEVDKAPLGWPGKYTSCCIGENEEDSPFEPLHVERGFSESDSTVTVLPANGMWPITETSPDPEQVLHHVTHGMAVSGHSAGTMVPAGHENILTMSPVIANLVAKLKPTKAELRQHLFEHARVPLDFYPPYRWEASRKRAADLGLRIENDRYPIVDRPESILVLCAGGKGGLQSCGQSTMLGLSVTMKINGP